MVLSYIHIILIVCPLIIIILRILFLILMKDKKRSAKKKLRETPAKTMIILGSGGHTAEMLRIVKLMDYEKYTPRIYVSAFTDNLSIDKVNVIEKNENDYKIIRITRSREVGQSYISSVWTTIMATLEATSILWSEKPELLLCNGPEIHYKTLLMMACEVQLINESIDWILLKEDLKYLPNEIEVHLVSIIDVLRRFNLNKFEKTKWINKSLITIEACLDRTWQILNSGHWKDVPISYRYSYSFCSLIKVILLEIEEKQENQERSSDTEIKVLQEIIQQIDKGILLGAPLPNEPSLLTSIASKINNYYNKFVRTLNVQKIEIDYSQVSQSLLPEFVQINRYKVPSMELFYKDIFIPKIPVIITDSMKHWNALHLWQDIDYLNKIAGSRTVPIEIGSRYTEEDWSQSLITFSEFLQSHIIKDTQKVAYLAQHQLFDQIPELQNDIVIPDYCSFSDKEDVEVEPPDINAWFGPAGTVSPLHFDIKNNLLCQVFGYKRIFLYNPSDSINLYPYDTKLLYNTAQVDPLKPDYVKWPNMKKAKGLMCYLGPGEMLYIPPKWWHHVTALTTSFSVSFWWT